MEDNLHEEIKVDTISEDYILVNGNKIFINENLRKIVLDEFSKSPNDCSIQQFADISKIPGIHSAVGLPDFHKGYALPIGSAAAVNIDDSDACVSPDGVGFDINCGVRCLKTNLTIQDMSFEVREKLADLLIAEIPLEDKIQLRKNPITLSELNRILDGGMKYLLEKGISTERDILLTESNGLLEGNSKLISQSAKMRGIQQIGTLGSGNHYLEFQVVENICDPVLCQEIGITLGQILISIHSGSRGLGHGCCSDILKEFKNTKLNMKEEYRKIREGGLSREEIAERCKGLTEKRKNKSIKKDILRDNIEEKCKGLTEMREDKNMEKDISRANIAETYSTITKMREDKSMEKNILRDNIAETYSTITEMREDKLLEKDISRDNIAETYSTLTEKRKYKNMEGLTYLKYDSPIGKKYISVMNSASNYAWANRSFMTLKIRECLKQIYPNSEVELISDVCHNIAKIEKGSNGENFLVHRKGASRILPPGHEDLPDIYKSVGFPILIGGSMGTYSYLVVGTEGCKNTCYSACHGAGRVVSRAKSRQSFNHEDVIKDLKNKEVVIRYESEKGLIEEYDGCYKDINEVVFHSQKVGISKNVCRVKPILVIKS